MKFPGQSWQNELTRANLADHDRQATAARKRPATPSPRPADATKAPAAPATPSTPSRPRWARRGGDHPNDYRMTPEESDQ